MKSITLTVPMPPNIANRQMHHMVKHRFKLGYWAVLDNILFGIWDDKPLKWLVKYQVGKRGIAQLKRDAHHLILDWILRKDCRVPKPESPFPVARISSVMYVARAMDKGNAMNRHKWIEDYLTERGFITNDDDKHLDWDGFPKQVVKQGQEYKIVITLTPLEEI